MIFWKFAIFFAFLTIAAAVLSGCGLAQMANFNDYGDSSLNFSPPDSPLPPARTG